MAMEKRSSAQITETVKSGQVKEEKDNIVKCATCGKVYLAAHGACPSCTGD